MPRLPTINPEALDAFVAEWATGNQNGRETTLKVKTALQEEFDIDLLSKSFQAAFA